eukprot:6173083-Pleurochrysis_carterae.AAC.1
MRNTTYGVYVFAQHFQGFYPACQTLGVLALLTSLTVLCTQLARGLKTPLDLLCSRGGAVLSPQRAFIFARQYRNLSLMTVACTMSLAIAACMHCGLVGLACR